VDGSSLEEAVSLDDESFTVDADDVDADAVAEPAT